MAVSGAAYAVDRDDDLRPDEDASVALPSVSAAASQAIERKRPADAAAVRAFLSDHLAHALGGDVDAYMADFVPRRTAEIEREFAARVMALPGLDIKVGAVDFGSLSAKNATVHVRQVASYDDAAGTRVVDDAVISYRLVKGKDGLWRVDYSERYRLEGK